MLKKTFITVAMNRAPSNTIEFSNVANSVEDLNVVAESD